MVENIVAIELAYINTKHPDFFKDAASIGSMLTSPDLETDPKMVCIYKYLIFLSYSNLLVSARLLLLLLLLLFVCPIITHKSLNQFALGNSGEPWECA